VKPHKNLERLISAFAAARQHGGLEDVKLILIGDEVSKQGSLRRTMEAAGLRHDVRFFGFVPDRTLACLYRMASAFAFPSLYEGFGLPPLEAMACGAPVVTSRLSSLPEVVGDAALLVDPYSVDDIASALRRVILDDALRKELIARGHARARAFSWEQSIERIHAAYLRALGAPLPVVEAPQAR
jgi:glycosyltransferase involved in cell wall biosynthesis